MELKENEIMLGENVYKIKPVKLKYMEIGWYNGYTALKEQGLIKTLNKEGRESLLDAFFRGVFDVPQIEGELLEDLNENLNAVVIKKIIEITENINEIKE